ncbi:MAG: propionate kinase, partial [Promethearchaeota archaeon]
GVNLDEKKNQQAVGGVKEEEISTEDSAVKVLVIPTDEERVIVEDTLAILTDAYNDHMHFPYSFTV